MIEDFTVADIISLLIGAVIGLSTFIAIIIGVGSRKEDENE